jgi:hypothetical protein
LHPHVAAARQSSGRSPRHPDESLPPSTRIRGAAVSAPEFVDFDEALPPGYDPATIRLPHLPGPADHVPQPRKSETRRGRHLGPRPVIDPRSARLDLRCTPAVRAKAEAAARAAGVSVAGYVASLIDGQPGPRTHRSPSEATKLLAQILGQMGKRGSNLNQGVRALHQINIVAGEGETRDRLAELIDELAAQHRQAIDEHRECVAALLRALGLRPDADHY